jgi:sugar lactone lactonase YvrE
MEGVLAGFSLSTFATNLPNTGGVGPLGAAATSGGGVMATDEPGHVRVFATDADNQDASAVAAQGYGAANAGGLVQVGNRFYMTQQANGAVVQLNPDGTLNQTIAASITGTAGIVYDPANGHLLVSTTLNGKIYDVDPAAKTATPLLNATFDGMAITPDGKTLYGADPSSNHVFGEDLATKTTVFDSGPISGGVNGVALASGNLGGDLVVSTGDGRLVVVNAGSLTQFVLADGGTRGDLLSPDGNNGSLLVTQNDRIMRLTAPAGSGFLFPALTEEVVTASPTTAAAGQAVKFTATVIDANANPAPPGGVVDFEEGGVILATGTLDVTGTATGSASFTTVGALNVIAHYEGGTAGAIQLFSGDSQPASVTITPLVNVSTAGLPVFAETLTITGLGFDPDPTMDQVTFSGGVTGTVTAATATSLTVVGLSGLAGGPLTATVTVDAVAGTATQVATVEDLSVALMRTDGSLAQLGPGSNLQQLSPPGTILGVSAVTDGAGKFDVFAVTTAGRNLWEHTSAGWVMLSAGSFAQISAATNSSGAAVVFGALTDKSLWEYNSPVAGGWTMLSPAGSVLAISGITDSAGHDTVYAVTADTHLWEHTPASWCFLSAGSFSQISAGLNAAGQAEVFAVLADNSLWENNPAVSGSWRLLSMAGTVRFVSAGRHGEVFAITADRNLWRFDATVWARISTGSFAFISVTENPAGQGEVFATLTDSSFWWYDPAIPAVWLDLFDSGAAFSSAGRPV